jgi:hypothetical protein
MTYSKCCGAPVTLMPGLPFEMYLCCDECKNPCDDMSEEEKKERERPEYSKPVKITEPNILAGNPQFSKSTFDAAKRLITKYAFTRKGKRKKIVKTWQGNPLIPELEYLLPIGYSVNVNNMPYKTNQEIDERIDAHKRILNEDNPQYVMGWNAALEILKPEIHQIRREDIESLEKEIKSKMKEVKTVPIEGQYTDYGKWLAYGDVVIILTHLKETI